MIMPAPILLDLTHTSHTRARTGIQRVARSLQAALGRGAIPITHDPHRGVWRPLQPWESNNLDDQSGGSRKRGASWPLAKQLLGRAARWTGRATPELPPNSGLLVPEVFAASVGEALPGLFAQVSGPRVAVFHDAIALQFPELSPLKTVARFPSYLRELLSFDGIAANSETSRDALRDYWQWLGATDAPPVEAIPLGVQLPVRAATTVAASEGRAPTVLCVGTIEGRKNHLALLEACERLWGRGLRFELRLVGLANRETGAAAVARVRELQAAGRPLIYAGALAEGDLAAAYAECAFTVYPSIVEGFGLPVIESLAHGKPCICSARGALGESARGGGCMALESVDSGSLAQAIAALLGSAESLAKLSGEASSRKFRQWPDYAADLSAWLAALPRRN